MSIVITNDLLLINPAYNDSIIEYQSDVYTFDAIYSTITIAGIPIFKTYPINGKFTFNFKSIVSNLINENNFVDAVLPDFNDSTILDDDTLSYTLSPSIKVYQTDSTFEETNPTWKFTKNVEQLIGYSQKAEITKNVSVLLPTTNKTDYFIPFFEGYPADFAIFGIANEPYYFKNISTVNQSPTYTGNSHTKRIFLSDGGFNADNDIGLSITDNLVELWVNGSFNSNITIRKYDSACGVYLKWFNDAGSYSYWLFEPIYTDTLTTKAIDEINGSFDNLQNISATSRITGKQSNKTLRLTTKYKDDEKTYLTSILSSPLVELYIHGTPFNKTDVNKFIGVVLNDGSFSSKNKNTNNRLDITITLPSINTQTL